MIKKPVSSNQAVKEIPSSELELKPVKSSKFKPELEDIELYFVMAYEEIVQEFNSLVHIPAITNDSVSTGMLVVCRQSIVDAYQSNKLYYPSTLGAINLMIGWLKSRAGIDIDAMKSQLKKDGTLKAKQARLNKSEMLAEKIVDLATPLIVKYPKKPATEIYQYLISDLRGFAKANRITTGLSEKVVTAKISAVKNSSL